MTHVNLKKKKEKKKMENSALSNQKPNGESKE